jgi:phenylpyruvate tautomerase PptA (4-oxalocrotonate tautomerase family)
MPYLKINTNQALDNVSESKLASAASPLLAKILGKPESYIMIEIQSGVSMQFAGSTEPLAYLELKSIGLPESRSAELSKQLCDFISSQLDISIDRIYIEFSSAQRHLWGWNGSTF